MHASKGVKSVSKIIVSLCKSKSLTHFFIRVKVNTTFLKAKKRERLKGRKEGGKRGRTTQSFKAIERMACLLDACRRQRANETIIDFLQLVEKRTKVFPINLTIPTPGSHVIRWFGITNGDNSTEYVTILV